MVMIGRLTEVKDQGVLFDSAQITYLQYMYIHIYSCFELSGLCHAYIKIFQPHKSTKIFKFF